MLHGDALRRGKFVGECVRWGNHVCEVVFCRLGLIVGGRIAVAIDRRDGGRRRRAIRLRRRSGSRARMMAACRPGRLDVFVDFEHHRRQSRWGQKHFLVVGYLAKVA